jgi:hypothetical protein
VTATGASSNGRGSDAWCETWRDLRVDRRSAGDCRVTFDHPPVNALSARTVAELSEVVGLIEQDHDLNVVVFASANPGYYLTSGDVVDDWPDLLARLSRAPVVSIAALRGQARGAGSEFVHACDVRLALRDHPRLDSLLDGMIDAIAGRLARCDREEIVRAKAQVR